MAFNVQTAGDEAIYVKFPGASGRPTPASGRSITLPEGTKEVRRIWKGTSKTDANVIWAHKWRLGVSGENATIGMSSNDTKFTRSGNTGRCKDNKTITVTVTPSSGYSFDKWNDGSTVNPRTFTMRSHFNMSFTCIKWVTVRFFQYYNGPLLKTEQIPAGSISWAPSTSIYGWTFSAWNGSTEYGQPVYSDTDYYGSWVMVRSTDEFTIHKKFSEEEPTHTTSSWSSSGNYKLAYRYAAKTGHTTVLFNKADKTVGGVAYSGYYLPVGAYMTIDLTNATITHTANPVNHYMKISCALLPSSIGDNPVYSDINTAFKNSSDAGEWEVVTAPEEASAGGRDTFVISAGACRINQLTNTDGYIAVRCAKLTGKNAKEEDESIVSAADCVVDWKVALTITCRI